MITKKRKQLNSVRVHKAEINAPADYKTDSVLRRAYVGSGRPFMQCSC